MFVHVYFDVRGRSSGPGTKVDIGIGCEVVGEGA